MHVHVLPLLKKAGAFLAKCAAPIVAAGKKLREEFAPSATKMEAARTAQASASSSAVILVDECRTAVEKLSNLERELRKRLLHAKRERRRLSDGVSSEAEARIAVDLSQNVPVSVLSILTGQRRTFMKGTLETTGKLNDISVSAAALSRQAHEWQRSLELALNSFRLPKYMAKQWEDILHAAEANSSGEALSAHATGEPETEGRQETYSARC